MTFKSLSALNKYISAAGDNIKKDEIFELENGMKYMYIADERTLVPLAKAQASGDLVTMSNEELNAQIISQQPTITLDVLLEEWVPKLNDWARMLPENDGYFMLLNNEAHYYTVFNRPHMDEELHFLTLGEAILRCANVVGEIKEINLYSDTGEIWIENKFTKDTNCYLLFNYDGGVATYGGY